MKHWLESNNTLSKSFVFDSYLRGLEFVNKVGSIAEEHQHHPDVLLSWGKVTITTFTHDAGNIVTDKDRTLAIAIDTLYEKEYTHLSKIA